MNAQDIADELRELAFEINRVANCMVDYADKAENKEEIVNHARELIGASQMVTEWACCISDENA